MGKAKLTLRNFGIRRGDLVAVNATLRGDAALTVLNNGLAAKERELSPTSFSDTGDFGFGIQEHIDMGYKYHPNTGIFGLDILVVLSRRGKRVSCRKIRRGRIGNTHRITKEEAQNFFVSKLGGILASN